MSQLDDALNALQKVNTTPDGHVTVGASVGGQHVDLPTPLKLSNPQAQAVHDVQAVASILHQAVDHGHVNPTAAVLALAYAMSRGWLK